MNPESSQLTIDELLCAMAPEIWNDDSWPNLPAWPGDSFAVAALLLERSGAYSGLGTAYWRPKKNPQVWEKEASAIASQWRRRLPDGQAPVAIKRWWSTLAESYALPISEISDNPDLCEALVKIIAVCDEVFQGVGVLSYANLTDQEDKRGSEEFKFWYECMHLLGGDTDVTEEGDVVGEWDQQPTLCRAIHPTRLRVMPKAQTPKYGLSIRSFTHHICLCPQLLMKASWNWHASVHADMGDHFCNILLFPWPFEVTPRQFSAAKDYDGETIQDVRHPETGWFEYQPVEDTDTWQLANLVVEYIDRAEKSIGKIHVLLLPEAALTESQYLRLQEVAHDKRVILISGVVRNGAQEKTNAAGVTFARLLDGGKYVDFEQNKHHRWKLDEDQIVRYSLTGVLAPEYDWWESIAISDRSLSVFQIREWLCTCALICEDLARLDPAGQVIRAMAPDLVIALLFDGPQLATRWPAYYATVLAEDPGSSVLTLTSLGMARLSRPTRHDPNIENDVIGMWRDIKHSAIEIRLPRDKTAAVLTVQRKNVPVTTADGRSKNINALTPIFGGLSYL